MSETALATGRSAYERGDWRSAHRNLSQARHHTSLDVEDLARLSRAAFGCGEFGDTVDTSEELYRRLMRDGDTAKAAMRALDLALMWVLHGDVVVGSGWINRARRILRTEPEIAAHGFLLYLDARYALMSHDSGPAVDAATELMRMGERLDSASLSCLSLVLSGMVDVGEGRCAQGFAQLDEAMLPVLAGRVAPEWAGDIYCTVIHLCHQLADLRRMRAWTEATERWCRQFDGNMIYSGVCRVHQLQLLSSDGDWDGVEAALIRSSSEMEVRHAWAAGEAHYQLGEILRLRGRVDEAWASFARARALGIDPQPGVALLHVAAGHVSTGWSALCAALNVSDRLARTRLLRHGIEMAVAQGLMQEAEQLCADLEETAATFSSAGFQAWAHHARAIVLIAQDRPADALTLLRRAARTYHDTHSQYEIANVHELMGVAHERLGQPELAAVNVSAATEVYRILGAVADLQRIAPTGAPGGLTQREADVLTRVAAGASNKEIAAALFISDKTVGRHLSNIFLKLDVTSRTAAAAWAHEHHLMAGPTAGQTY